MPPYFLAFCFPSTPSDLPEAYPNTVYPFHRTNDGAIAETLLAFFRQYPSLAPYVQSLGIYDSACFSPPAGLNFSVSVADLERAIVTVRQVDLKHREIWYHGDCDALTRWLAALHFDATEMERLLRDGQTTERTLRAELAKGKPGDTQAAEGKASATQDAKEKKKRGREPMTPEYRKRCEEYAKQYHTYLEAYITREGANAGARKAFATSKGLKIQESNAMIRSGTPKKPPQHGRKRRG